MDLSPHPVHPPLAETTRINATHSLSMSLGWLISTTKGREFFNLPA